MSASLAAYADAVPDHVAGADARGRLLVVAFVFVLLSTSAWAATASGADSRQGAVLHLYETRGPAVFIDNDPKGAGPSVGDVFVYTNAVFTRHGRRIGQDHRVCTVVGPLLFSCTATLQLPKGQLMRQGLVTAASTAEAVVGGTGAFVGARGVLITRTVDRYTTIEITLR